MSISDSLQKNKVVVFVASAAILGSAVYLFNRPAADPLERLATPTDSRYFYDTSKNEIFVGLDFVPPISRDSKNPTKGEKVGVWAHIRACGDCKDESKRKVVYLQTFSDDVSAELAKTGKSGTLAVDLATPEQLAKSLVKRPKDKNWVSLDSDEARVITEEMAEPCPDGSNVLICQP